MHRFLILSVFILLSCGTQYKIANTLQEKSVNKVVKNPYFNQIGKEYSYRFKITFMKNEMKGNFIVKKIDDSTHRAVMTSDFGNTLFDLSITNTDYTLHYAMPDLNKKIVVNTLADDLQTIFKNDFQINQQIDTDDLRILKSKEISLSFPKNEPIYFNELTRLNNNKIKTINTLKVDETDYIPHILIKHNHFNLSIELTKSIPLLEE
jgi:hypothetical protein